MKLNPRLALIERMVADRYQHIWDCCCDHGLLGMHLLERLPETQVHFVDQVPALMARLNEQLARFFPEGVGRRWSVHTDDVRTLQLAQVPGSQLVIIAGVGGDLTLEMVQALCEQHPDQELEFLLCPVRQHFLLRSTLATQGVAMLNEHLVEERGRFYEVLHLTTGEGALLSSTGSRMWQLTDPSHQRYLQSLLSHYQRQSVSQPSLAQPALDAYRQLQDFFDQGS